MWIATASSLIHRCTCNCSLLAMAESELGALPHWSNRTCSYSGSIEKSSTHSYFTRNPFSPGPFSYFFPFFPSPLHTPLREKKSTPFLRPKRRRRGKKTKEKKSKTSPLLTEQKDSLQRVSRERDNLVGYSRLHSSNYFFHPSSTRSQKTILIPFLLPCLSSYSTHHNSEFSCRKQPVGTVDSNQSGV